MTRDEAVQFGDGSGFMKLFRAMICDDDGLPRVGSDRNMLGIRPNESAISVTIDPMKVRFTIRPPAFSGSNPHTTMFDIEERVFHPMATTQLLLGPINPKTQHAEILRAEPPPIADALYQTCLANTRPSWAQTSPGTVRSDET